jgi:hypothetical protein
MKKWNLLKLPGLGGKMIKGSDGGMNSTTI